MWNEDVRVDLVADFWWEGEEGQRSLFGRHGWLGVWRIGISINDATIIGMARGVA